VSPAGRPTGAPAPEPLSGGVTPEPLSGGVTPEPLSGGVTAPKPVSGGVTAPGPLSPRATAPDPVRIGLIGAGRMGLRHLRALEGARGVTVAAVVEPAQPARDVVAARGYRVFARPGQMPEGGVDAVLIAAPSDLHRALVQAAAERGLPALCEKPVGVHLADAVAACDAAAAHRTLLQVGYWRRFVPQLRRLREQIAGGELGDICQLSCLQWDGEPPAPAFRARSGGIAVDMAVHEFDQARWLTGQELTWLAAAPAGDAPGRDPGAATILASMSGGAALTVSVGRRFPHGDSCWLEVFGTRGYQRVPFMWGEAGDAVFDAALTAQVEAFAARVRGEPVQTAGGEDAVAALTAAELAGQALLDGQRHEIRSAAVGR
jgi:myo-inositol 2-dehydrogenase / D-chiro-inositol 1-dehydrogenase